MKKIATIATLFAAAFAATSALADNAFPPAISVSGEASVSAAPDLVQIVAGVASNAKTAKEASHANSAAMNKLMLALKDTSIDEQNFQTSQLSLQPQYSSNGTRTVGFRASNRVTVKIHDVTKVADVIDRLVSAGANDIDNISFDVTKASELLDNAREQAMADARRKAEIYAKAAGITLGAPISISEGSRLVPPSESRRAEVASAPVAAGEQTLSVTVNVSWAIKIQSPQ